MVTAMENHHAINGEIHDISSPFSMSQSVDITRLGHGMIDVIGPIGFSWGNDDDDFRRFTTWII